MAFFCMKKRNKTKRKRMRKMKVITKPSQMPKPLIWNPMDEEWKRTLEKTGKWWYKSDGPNLENERERKAMERILPLRERLLEFGGNIACMDLYDEDAEKIMERGQFWYGEHARMKKGRPSQCHSNSALLWDANREKCQIATGYALSADGCWRQHSWVVQPLTTKYRIWETTEKRIAYFGFILNDEECEEFYYNN